MKNKILSVLFLLVVYSFAKTDFSVITTGTTDFSVVCPRIKIFLNSREEEKKIGYYGFANMSLANWTFYNGPKFHLVKWINFGLYAGLETSGPLKKTADIRDAWRIAADITFLYKELVVYTLYENGASSFFFMPVVCVKINDRIKTDIRLKAVEGITKIGPGLQITTLKHLTIRIATFYCFQKEKSELELGTIIHF